MKPPPLKDDCFALPPGVHWTPVDEALGLLRSRLAPITETEDVAVADADGRILAEPVQAARSNPPLANSAVDGYGFAHGSLSGGDVTTLPLVEGRAAAGRAYAGTVPAGTAIRILTGAALPDGVDTVVLEEDCSLTPSHVAFRGGLKRGANTRRAGEDVAGGADLFAPGHRLDPQDLALLAATGVEHLCVRRRLRVGVLSTGDEIVEAGSAAAPGLIYDANRPMLRAILSRWGHAVVDLGHASDDRDVLRDRLNRAAENVDAILTSGGASAGDEDHLSALLGAEGHVHSWRIAIKPGRPLALGQWRGVPLFGLPGNPVAAFVCTLVFARPALEVLAGGTWRTAQGFRVPAAFAKAKKPGRREFLRARLVDGAAEVFRSEGSGRISGLSWADGLVELPDGAVDLAIGDPVAYYPYSEFGL
jgi:molybdopterin molybdotransferase